MIGREYDICIVEPALLFQMFDNFAYAVVNELVAGVYFLMNLANTV